VKLRGGIRRIKWWHCQCGILVVADIQRECLPSCDLMQLSRRPLMSARLQNDVAVVCPNVDDVHSVWQNKICDQCMLKGLSILTATLRVKKGQVQAMMTNMPTMRIRRMKKYVPMTYHVVMHRLREGMNSILADAHRAKKWRMMEPGGDCVDWRTAAKHVAVRGRWANGR
jgi:hypothetical protein